MAKKDEKTNDYRSERKERLAKSSKKRNKKPVDSTKVASVVIIVICALAVLACICGGLYAYGVPQSILPAVTVGDTTYSIAEYSYYYTSAYQTYANQSYSYKENYGFSIGFDYEKDPAAQTTTDDDGNTITYADFFDNYVVKTLESYTLYLKKAAELGITLSDANKAEIESTISTIADNASSAGYSTDRYVSVLYGKGLNVKKLRSILEDQYIVSQYLATIEDDCYSAITDDAIETEYAANAADYQQVDLRVFGFTVEKDSTSTETTTAASEATTTASETTTAASDTTTAASDDTTAAAEAEKTEPTELERLAQEMCDKITDENSFITLAREYCDTEDAATFADDTATLASGITKATVKSNIDEELAEWLFSGERKTGDKTTCSTDSYIYVIYVVNTPYRVDSPLVDARHILVSFDTIKTELEKAAEESGETTSTDTTATTGTAADGTVVTNEGTEYSVDVVLKAYEAAAQILSDYKAGEMTEDAFAKLAEDNSDDTASIGDKGEGGLYENIKKGAMVAPFENWVYDSARQPGDTGLVMSNYGWHVMYFVKAHEEASWKETIRETLGKASYDAKTEELTADTADSAKLSTFESLAYKLALKNVNKTYINK